MIEQGIRSAISYDPQTGEFRWLRKKSGCRSSLISGHKNKRLGYVQIGVNRKVYYAHRLAWLLTFGDWPTGAIDHINGDRSDNRISNLRLADARLNAENLRRPTAINTSGYLGVTHCRDTGRWVAQIGVGGKHLHLGRFDTPESASVVYLAAKRKYHAGCTI